jgi:hypothetical protein
VNDATNLDAVDRGMPRRSTVHINCSVPRELLDEIRERLPGLNISRLLQDALRDELECAHDEYICSGCGKRATRTAIVGPALAVFYSDLMWELGILVRRSGTAEGAARLAKELAGRHQVPDAHRVPLPRPTRMERDAAKIRQLPPPGPVSSETPAQGRGSMSSEEEPGRASA